MKNVGGRYRKIIHRHLYNYIVNNYLGVLTKTNDVNCVIATLNNDFDKYYDTLISGSTAYFPLLISKDERIDRDNARVAKVSFRLSDDKRSLLLSVIYQPLCIGVKLPMTCNVETIDISTCIPPWKYTQLISMDVDNVRMAQPIIKELLNTLSKNGNDVFIKDNEKISDNDMLIMSELQKACSDMWNRLVSDTDSSNTKDTHLNKDRSSTLGNCSKNIIDEALNALKCKHVCSVTVNEKINDTNHLKVSGEIKYYTNPLNNLEYEIYSNKDDFSINLKFVCKGNHLDESKCRSYEHLSEIFSDLVNPFKHASDLLESMESHHDLCEDVRLIEYINKLNNKYCNK